MPNFLSNDDSIQGKWGRPPELSAPNIGTLVGEILRNKLLRDKMTGESIADTIKNVRNERQADEYLRIAKEWGVVPADYEAGGVGGAAYGSNLAKQIEAQRRTTLESEQQGYMKPYYEALTERAGRPDARGARGAPRYPYTIPGTDETVDLTGGDYAKRRSEDITSGSYQGILKQEADAKAEMQRLATVWGGDTGGKLKQNWSMFDPKKEQWQKDWTRDQILYNRAQQQYQMNQQQRENLEKRKPGIVGGAPAPVDTGTDTEDQTDTGGTAPLHTSVGEPNKPVTSGEKIDQATVAQYIKKAGGDTAAARRMAQEDGWTF